MTELDQLRADLAAAQQEIQSERLKVEQLIEQIHAGLEDYATEKARAQRAEDALAGHSTQLEEAKQDVKRGTARWYQQDQQRRELEAKLAGLSTALRRLIEDLKQQAETHRHACAVLGGIASPFKSTPAEQLGRARTLEAVIAELQALAEAGVPHPETT